MCMERLLLLQPYINPLSVSIIHIQVSIQILPREQVTRRKLITNERIRKKERWRPLFMQLCWQELVSKFVIWYVHHYINANILFFLFKSSFRVRVLIFESWFFWFFLFQQLGFVLLVSFRYIFLFIFLILIILLIKKHVLTIKLS